VKESRIENKNESQWAEHKASFTCERAELDIRFMYLIRQPIVILARNKSIPTENRFRIKESTALALSLKNHELAQRFPRDDEEGDGGDDAYRIPHK
jgi:hypothetical protein